MPKINIYRIDKKKEEIFIKTLEERFQKLSNKANDKGITIKANQWKIDMYIQNEVVEKEVSWKWIIDEFTEVIVNNFTNPKGVLVLENEKNKYACTFGNAYFLADKFCDSDFPFSFIRRHKIEQIKTTALTTQSETKNREISSYLNYNHLEFTSGEAFSKIKCKLKLEPTVDCIKQQVEAGSSLKLNITENTIQGIIDAINYAETAINKGTEINKIPVFNKVKDEQLLERLFDNVLKDFQKGRISLTEFDIVGTTEVFEGEIIAYDLVYGKTKEHVEAISAQVVSGFIEKVEIQNIDELKKVKVHRYNDDQTSHQLKLVDLIDFYNEEKNCILLKGEWYIYNEDYMHYLNESIDEIKVIYDAEFDMDIGKKEDDFNKNLHSNYGYELYDKDLKYVKGHAIELMDLYKDNTAYSVKIGSASSKLCHAVDQSIESLRFLKSKSEHKIENVALWLILERVNKLNNKSNGEPNINELKMLILKRRIDEWKKNVRKEGFVPIIHINYRNKI